MDTTYNGMYGGTIQTVSDDFQFGSSEAGEVGELGWNSGSAGGTGGNTNGVASELDHPGIMSAFTSATAGSRFHVSGSGLHVRNAKRFMTLVRIPASVSNVQVRFGLLVTIAASAEDSRGMYFSYDAATSPRWRSVTRGANGITVKEFTGRVGPVVADKWYLLDLQVEPGYVVFRLNNREEARHETNIPVDEMVDKGWVIQTIDAAVKTLHIDYYLQRLVTYADARF